MIVDKYSLFHLKHNKALAIRRFLRSYRDNRVPISAYYIYMVCKIDLELSDLNSRKKAWSFLIKMILTIPVIPKEATQALTYLSIMYYSEVVEYLLGVGGEFNDFNKNIYNNLNSWNNR